MPVLQKRRVGGMAAIGLAALLSNASQGADGTGYTLRNGAKVEARSVKETTDRVFVDLGFDILGIPLDQIAQKAGLGRQSLTSATLASAAPAPSGEGFWQEITAEERRERDGRSHIQILEAAKKSVVIVSTPSGWGTGFAIDRHGRLLTNQHVVLDEKYVDVTIIEREGGRLVRNKIKNVELLALSPLLDIALLQLPEKDAVRLNLQPLPVAGEGSLTNGDAVYAIGNPGMGSEMLDLTLSEGIVSSLDRNFNDVLYIQTTAAVNPGNSGGPLVNGRGEVVGLVSLKAIFQEGIAFALPVDYIRFFLRSQKAFAYGKTNPNTGYHYLPPD